MSAIIRPINLLLLLAVQFSLWYRLCMPHWKDSMPNALFFFILIAFSALCTAAAGYVINDMEDLEIDKINKPGKVFIGKSISFKQAFFLYQFLNLLGILTAVLLWNIYILLIVGLSALLLYFYSKILKRTVFWGNLTVAVLATFPILEIYLFFADNSADIRFLAYGIFAFLSTLIREIVKDMEDLEGDTKQGAITLAAYLSKSQTKILLFFLNSLLLLCLTLIFTALSGNMVIESKAAYLLLMMTPSLLIYFFLFRAAEKKDYSKLSLLLKIYMFLGLIWLWI